MERSLMRARRPIGQLARGATRGLADG
jgi:hypothetical protein